MSSGGSPPQEGEPSSSLAGIGLSLGGAADASRLTGALGHLMPRGSMASSSAGTPPDHQIALGQGHQLAGSLPASNADLRRLTSLSPTPRGEPEQEEGRPLCSYVPPPCRSHSVRDGYTPYQPPACRKCMRGRAACLAGIGHWALGIGRWAVGRSLGSPGASRALTPQARRGATPARNPSHEVARGSCV